MEFTRTWDKSMAWEVLTDRTLGEFKLLPSLLEAVANAV
jgi:hypothetical protein